MTNNMKYPITITEEPHRGPAKTWILYSPEHLQECISSEERLGYHDYQVNEGRIVYEENSDGELIEVKNEGYTLKAYLDWLFRDLSELTVTGFRPFS